VVLTTHLLLAPRSQKGRAIPLFHPLGQFRPVTGVLYFYLYTVDFNKMRGGKKVNLHGEVIWACRIKFTQILYYFL
jgi:hypothetical protein